MKLYSGSTSFSLAREISLKLRLKSRVENHMIPFHASQLYHFIFITIQYYLLPDVYSTHIILSSYLSNNVVWMQYIIVQSLFGATCYKFGQNNDIRTYVRTFFQRKYVTRTVISKKIIFSIYFQKAIPGRIGYTLHIYSLQ